VKAVSAEIDRDLHIRLVLGLFQSRRAAWKCPTGEMRRLDIEDGRYFAESDFGEHRRVVILGNRAAKRVFQGAPAIGENVSIAGLEFEVIGTLRDKIQDSMYNGPDNEQGFVPYHLMRDLRI